MQPPAVQTSQNLNMENIAYYVLQAAALNHDNWAEQKSGPAYE